VEILRPGKDVTTYFFGTCFKCDCEIKVTSDDGEYIYDEREYTGFVKIDCPTPKCGRQINCYQK